MLAIIIETKYMYLVEHNDVFIALVATSCGRNYSHQASAVQNFNGCSHVVHQNVKLYGIYVHQCQYMLTALHLCYIVM
jgi:hypothetical protein